MRIQRIILGLRYNCPIFSDIGTIFMDYFIGKTVSKKTRKKVGIKKSVKR